MKPLRKKSATQRAGARRPRGSRAKALTKQRSVHSGGSPLPKKKVVRPKPRRTQPASNDRVQPPDAQPELRALAEEILKEIRTLQAALRPKLRAPRGNDDELESTTISIRRLLSEALERDHETLLSELILTRRALTDPRRSETSEAVGRLDRMIKRLGAQEFSAQELDFVDPVIHEIKAERCVERLPDGVVAESLRPGIRSRNGVVIAKAWIAVNRRSAHEPARD